ncbi:MAG: urate hydroxylase PuuD [Candidatus Eisenbacteria bacterium]
MSYDLLPPLVTEWLNLLVRWIHVIAAIMWIGDSFLFMWMDSSLSAPTRPRAGAVAGELWLVHGGGFYEVVKRRFLAPEEMPPALFWFKWQSYSTWISGFLLLAIVYYLGGGTYLVDPVLSKLGHGAAVGVSLAMMAVAWLVYDALWMSPAGRNPRLAASLSFGLLALAAWGCTAIFAGRAAYLQFGAIVGTVMTANVWRRIVPAQNQMLAATRAGTAVDASLGLRAKTRSIHNHYLTLPVLFTMLSNHYPATYGHAQNAVVLLLIVVVGMSLKHAMNFRMRSNRWIVAAGLAALAAAIAMTVRTSAPVADPALASEPAVAYAEVQTILEQRCLTCHAAKPTHPAFPVPPSGIILEDPRRVRELAARLLVRVVHTQTMPLGNLTAMTEAERVRIGAWVAQGAKIP